MELEELAERLALLEDDKTERAANEEKKSFFDKYGQNFSGDEGIGMAILGEMTRRGIGAASEGADKAVQEVLNQLREEAASLMDKINAQQQDVSSLMDDVKAATESVTNAGAEAGAEGEAGGAEGEDEYGMDSDYGNIADSVDLPPELLQGGGAPPEGAGAPPPADAGAPPPADAGMPPPPMDAGAPPPPPPDPSAVPSDRRIKTMKAITARKQGWKPSKSLIASIKGAF